MPPGTQALLRRPGQLAALSRRRGCGRLGAGVRPPRSYDWSPGSARSAGIIGSGETEWERQHPRWPGNTTVYRLFDSWGDLLEAAGFKAYGRRPPGTLAERVEAAQRLSASGLTNKAVARELDLGEGTVSRYLRAHPCRGCAEPVVGKGADCQRCATRSGNPKRWTAEEILEAFTEWTRLESRVPTQKDWRPAPPAAPAGRWDREFPRWPPAGAVRVSFGTWNELRVVTGAATYGVTWSREEIVEAMQRWHAEHGAAPAKSAWELAPPGCPSAATVRRAFDGSFVAAIRAAGLEPHRYRWDRARIIAVLRAVEAEHGRLPRSSEWLRAAPGRPTTGAVVKHFGDWRTAIEAATRSAR